MASIYDLKIFKLNRLKYEELWNDAIAWVKKHTMYPNNSLQWLHLLHSYFL